MKYQPHIDGLRALAVLPVVFFHLGLPWFSGGYVGVDVFFVISGFLITSILYADIKGQRYSLLEFYKRRMLRILPALIFVLLSTAVISIFVMLPEERESLGKSIVASAVFVSNFFFWQDSGYFTAPAESKPLLHMWSLAVEEQFYIFFPPLLFLIYRVFRGAIFSVVALAVLLSFVGGVLLTIKDQPTAFYLLPARAWELGIGALLALFVAEHGSPKRHGLWYSCIGLAFILGAVFLLDSESLFPGWNALFPCIGTMMLIGWGKENIVGRCLSWSPLVWIGKVSYSLYLWHWPLIVFWKIQYGEALSASSIAFLFFLALGLAALSTFYIEKPFRSRQARAMLPAKVVFSGGITLCFLVLVGWSVYLKFPSLLSYPEEVTALSHFVDYREHPDHKKQFRTGSCFIGEAEGAFSEYDKDKCAHPDVRKKNVILLGDSHAAQYAGAIQELYPDIHVMQATASGCRPLLGARGQPRCTDMRDWFFDDFLENEPVSAVIVAGRWQTSDMENLYSTLTHLKKSSPKVVLVGPTVEYEGELPLLLARAVWKDEPFNFEKFRTPGKWKLNNDIADLADKASVTYIDVLRAECGREKCKLLASDGSPMQFDYGHLTLSGALDVLGEVKEEFDEALLDE
ncbi:acyltransferase family protein [Alloalcanivorax xenomutans]|uniref:acyltransferase family protein n=1 Tax=Alloalcanivorax xenomutans TaxID=1094342 RepID=UPI0009C31917|nr:acyltransferase family protein [Alloalcanivorax xenomutans]ARB45409.1 hypothetical protein P40_08175 [Alloalcanivorax xenomutans]